MLDDVRTVVWKEWKEIVMPQAGSSNRGTQFKVAVALALFGFIIPWRAGPSYVDNPMSLVAPSIVPIFFLLGIVTDSFAGERERHTLETLLASRLSDEAILIGKVSCAVLVAWLALVAMLTLGLLGTNLAHGAERLLLFPTDRLVTTLIFNLLLSLVVSSAGVLVSLRAPTVRQAMQILTFGIMGIVYGGIFGFQLFLPPEWRAKLIEWFAGNSLQRTEIAVALFLLGLGAVLFAAARLRFRRARLILD